MKATIPAPDFLKMPDQVIQVSIDGYYDGDNQTFVVECVKYKGQQIDLPTKMTFAELLQCKKAAQTLFVQNLH